MRVKSVQSSGGLDHITNSDMYSTGPNFMALLTVSTGSALTEAGSSVRTTSIFHELAANIGVCQAYKTLLGILCLQG